LGEAPKAIEARSTRLLVTLARPVSEAALLSAGARGVVATAPGRLQIIVGPDAAALAEGLGAPR
jgi:phosphotransferase system IIB component